MKTIRQGENPVTLLKEDLEKSVLVPMILLKGTDVKNQEIRFFNTYEIINDNSYWLFGILLESYKIIIENSTVGVKRREIRGIGDPFAPANFCYYIPINGKVSRKLIDFLTKSRGSESNICSRDDEILERYINALNDKADAILISSLLVESPALDD